MITARGKSGFTLVEIIMVIIIAGIIFPAIIMPFYYATKGINLTVRREIMELLIQGEIEKDLMPVEYANAVGWGPGRAITGFDYVSEADYYFVDPKIGFNEETTGADTGYKRFTVTVTPTQGGSPLEVVLVLTKKSD